jgi:RNA polymerase sigma factor (sigma-70 family)
VNKWRPSAVRCPCLPLSTSVKKQFIPEATLRHMLDHPLLSREAEATLSERIKSGDENACHELVRHNLRLAWAFASRGEVGGSARTEDLFSEAVVALYHAARRFDSNLGTFAQFSEFRLREAWRKHARFEGYPPARCRVLREQADRVVWHLLERTGREPHDSEIAAALGWTRRQARSARGRPRPLSLQLPIDGDGAPLMDIVADEATESPAAGMLKIDLRDLLRASLGALEPRTRAIIERRFGFESSGATDLPPKNRVRPLRAVGIALGLSGERVRQLENEGLAQLRRALSEAIDLSRRSSNGNRHGWPLQPA